MKLDLSEILSRVGVRYPYAVDEPPIVDEDLECAGPIRGNIAFTNTGNVLLIGGQINTRVAMSCSRCLVYYEERIDAPIEEQFTLETRNIGPRGRQTQVIVEEDENPDAGRLFDGNLFDLTELLRQAVTLNLPTQPLHGKDCRGLCPLCGKDLNEGPCGCVPEARHPAFAKLKSLLEKKEGA